MAYVITQNCCKDASCVPVCPVDCIRPAGGAGEVTGTEMLYIDPVACIDCGACLDECPVDAIHYEDDLPPHLTRFKEFNAEYFERHPLSPGGGDDRIRHAPVPDAALRVAIVGSGPSACYAASELIAVDGVQVDLFERLPTPFGLIRAGVAPDHQHTKGVVSLFEQVFTDRRCACHLNVEIGTQLQHEDLLAHHHAVIYAAGASQSRDLGIRGEELLGNYAAGDFVGWYNGHPDRSKDQFDLSAKRAVIIGNGNVALDVARMLLASPDELEKTDIAAHALSALSQSNIHEVIIVGRRDVRHAAFSAGEFLALGYLDGIDVEIEDGDTQATSDDDVETTLKLAIAREYAQRATTPGNKRIIFRFMTSPTEIVGVDHVEGLVVSPAREETGAGERETIKTSLIFRSIGFRGTPIPSVPHSPITGTIPHSGGRVITDNGEPLPGVYVTGWIKRGPRGVIGTNRGCAEETVAAVFADFDNGALTREIAGREALLALMRERNINPIDWAGWRAIDSSERQNGSTQSRPRVKYVAIEEMLTAARG